MDIMTLAMAKAYVDDTANALGAVKGAPATIESITPVDGGNEVVFAWTGTDGTKQTQTMFVPSGSSVDLDTTLTQSGNAADAKATGEAINQLSEEIAELKEGEMITKEGTLIAVDLAKGASIKVKSDTIQTATLVHQNKNFLGGLAHDEKTQRGVTYTPNDDGSVKIVGTIEGASEVHFYHPSLKGVLPLPVGTYTLSFDFPLEGGIGTLSVYAVSDGKNVASVYNKNKPVTFVLTEPTSVRVAFNMDGSATGTTIDCTLHCQLEAGERATQYEQKNVYLSETVTFPVMLEAEDGENVIYTTGGDYLTVTLSVSNSTDDTLSKPGVAADAKATGEAINALAAVVAKNNATLTDKQIQACKRFAELFATIDAKADAFLFFTDQHLADQYDVKSNFDDALNQVAAVYNATPTSVCVSGGDWLETGNTKQNAAWVLGKIDGAMKRRFDKYVMVVGNHDTNYQGYEYYQSGQDGEWDREEHTKCILSNDAIRNLWNRQHDASYFETKIGTGVYYVFDSGLDWYAEMDEYRWTQVDWFAEKLKTDDPENSAVFMHDAMINRPFTDNVTKVARAYNDRATLTLNGKTYDFTGKTGVFRFVWGGHTHVDGRERCNGIQVATTKNLTNVAGEYTFDLMVTDFAADRLYTIRVGDGEDRIFNVPREAT